MHSLTQRSVLAAAGSIILPVFVLGCGVNATRPADDGGEGAVAAAKPGEARNGGEKTGASSPLPSNDPDAVAQMDAQLDGRDPTIRFIVDPADYGKVLRLFGKATVDRRPMDWKVLGHIWIKYKNGGTSYVWLFTTVTHRTVSDNEPGAYKIGETYYRGATDKEFIEILKACEEHSKAAKER